MDFIGFPRDLLIDLSRQIPKSTGLRLEGNQSQTQLIGDGVDNIGHLIADG